MTKILATWINELYTLCYRYCISPAAILNYLICYYLENQVEHLVKQYVMLLKRRNVFKSVLQ